MNKLLLLSLILLLWVGLASAQNVSVPQAVADGQVEQAKAQMDSEYAGIASDNADIAQLQSKIATQQQAMLAVATQTNPLPSAMAICSSNPSQYCPGYQPPTLPVLATTGQSCTQNSDCVSGNCYGTSGVNWTQGTCQ